MSSTWDRIDSELRRRRRNWQWLADRMGWTIQRLQNWKLRGVPSKVYPELATALDRSLDWVAGRADAATGTADRYQVGEDVGLEVWPFHRIAVKRVLALPAPEFERIQGFIEATLAGWEASGDDRKSRRG